MKEQKSGAVGASVFAAIVFVVLICVWICTTKVPAGYVAVKYNVRNGIAADVLSQGYHVTPPWIKTTLYSIGIEQSYLTSDKKGDSDKDESFKIPTSDGKTVVVNLEFSYRFDVDRVANTFTQFKGRKGEDIKDTFIKPKVIAWTQEVSANYPVTDIFGDKRTAINAELDTYLKEKFDPYGIIIDTVNFTDIAVDDETAASIQKKVQAQQELELANIEAKTAKVQADKDKEVALIQAEKDKEVALITAEQNREKAAIEAEEKRIKAEGEAAAIKIKAEAESEANRKIAESLSGSLLEKIKIEKWNGNVPTVQGSSTPIINMGN